MDNPLSTMDKKVKFVFIGLIGLLLVSVLFLFSTIASRAALMQEYKATEKKLTQENESLRQKVNQTNDEKRTIENRLSALERDLNKAERDREEIQRRYQLVVREKEDLVEQLRQKQPSIPTATTVSRPGEDAYWAQMLKEKVALEIQVSSLRKELADLKIEYEGAKREKSTTDLEIKNLTREKDDLEKRILYTEKMTDSLSSELVREKTDKNTLQSELKTLKNEHLSLLRQAKTLSNQKAFLEKQLSDAEAQRKELDKRIKDMSEMLDYKLSQVMEVKEGLRQIQEDSGTASLSDKSSVELPPIIVRSTPVSPAALPTQFDASVLAVNRDNNFVVIDIGEEDNLKPGTKFGVYRGPAKIANIEVIQTRRNVSACDIIQETRPINIGDQVR